MLQIAKEEYSRIISQIQNLKVQKERAAVSSDAKPNLRIVNNDVTSSQYLAKGFTKNQIRIATAGVITVLLVILLPLGFWKKQLSDNTVVLHEVDKNQPDKNQAVAKVEEKPSAPSGSGTVAAAATTPEASSLEAPPLPSAASATVAAADTKQPEKMTPPPAAAPAPAAAKNATETPAAKSGSAAVTAAAKTASATDSKPAAGAGGLYRGTLFVSDLKTSNEKIKAKMQELGAAKAGEVELGWLKTPKLAYYHYIIEEKNMTEAENFMKQFGSLHVKFEPHPRKVPAGSRRFIIEVKQN
jgi:hypothetical protein